MSSEEENVYGSLVFFRKNGEPGRSYPLTTGKTCIGSSEEADIRLKLKDERLEEIHCVVDVTEYGIATIQNNSRTAPVCVNTISVRKFKVLRHKDEIDLIGKKFLYMNDNVSDEGIEEHQELSNRLVNAPPKTRHSVAPVVSNKSTKESPNFKSKFPLRTGSSFNRSAVESVTPERKPDRTRFSDRPKTTSKVVASKALGSPIRTKRRRLSLYDEPNKRGRSPKVSERNFLLSNDVIDEETTDLIDLGNRSLPSHESPKKTNVEPTPVKSRRSTLPKALSTPDKTETPKVVTRGKDSVENKVKTLRNTPSISKRLELLKGTPNSGKTLTALPKTVGAATKRGKSENIFDRTPKTVSSSSRNGKSIIISISSTDLSQREEDLNGSDISSSDSDVFEELNPKDPRLSHGKASPKKYPRKSRQSDRLSRGSLGARPENTKQDPSEKFLQEETRRSILDRSSSRRSVRRSNVSSKEESFSEESEKNLSLQSKDEEPLHQSKTRNSTTLKPRQTFSTDNLNKMPDEINFNFGRSVRQSNVSTSEDSSSEESEKNLSLQSEEEESLRQSKTRDSRTLKPRQTYTRINLNETPKEVNNSNLRRSVRSNVSSSEQSCNEESEKNLSQQGEEEKPLHQSKTRNSTTRMPSQTSSTNNLSKTLEIDSSLRRSIRRSNVSSNEESFSEESEKNLSSQSEEERLRQSETKHPATHKLRQTFTTNNLNETPKEANSSFRRSVRRSNVSNNKESSSEESEKNLSLPSHEDESLLQSKARDSRTSKSNQMFTANSLNYSTKEVDESRDHSPTLHFSLSSLSSTPASDDNLGTSELSACKSRRSSRKSARIEKDATPGSDKSEKSDVRPLFVPQRRPPLRGSYVNQESVRESDQNRKSSLNIKPNDENDLPIVPRRVSRRKSTGHYCKTCETPPIKTLRRSSARDSYVARTPNQSASNEKDSILSNDRSERYTPKSQSYVSIDDSQSEDELSDGGRYSDVSGPRKSVAINKSYNSVIVVDDDSIKGTPENNTSIIILDSALKKSHKSHKKPSKTLNSTIDDLIELTTPKSAIKSRRSKSLPYNPIVEDITPVTPEETSGRAESGFKTPLNTPGLFENIKKSVLKSKGRRRTSNALREELDKAEVDRPLKRARYSTDSERSAKKMKMLVGTPLDSTIDEDLGASFASFATNEVFTTDIAEEYDIPGTPNDFKNLTDKPIITDPQAKSLTEPRNRRSASIRLSLHAMRLDSQFTESDVNSSSSSYADDSAIDYSEGSRRSSRLSSKASKENLHENGTPMNDISNKKFSTRMPVKSPKNDLTDVRGVRRLLKTPKPAFSPRNDLTNIIGVKKLLSTPKVEKSPKNDLTKIPNLRRLVYPVQQNSPKNDLTCIVGVKKLLSTPKEMKSPKNDLRNVPNLRKIMSPKTQNSPRNDLSNVAGVKKLMSTPKIQNSPLNDLTKVPNLQKFVSPKQQNFPKNDLSDVEGVADIFDSRSSDIENNDDIFNNLFVKKPIRTYRGKSLSPITRKAMLYGKDERKTLGDTPVSSPRIEKWLEDQAVIKLSKLGDTNSREELKADTKGTPRSRRRKPVNTDKTEDPVEKKPKGRARALQMEEVESPQAETRSLRRKQKNTDTPTKDEMNSSGTTKRRGRPRKVSIDEKIHSSGKGKKPQKDLDGNVDVEEKPLPKRRGRAKKISVDEPIETPERGRRIAKNVEDESIKEEVETVEEKPLPKRRGRARKVSIEDNARGEAMPKNVEDDSAKEENIKTVKEKPLPKRRGRPRNVSFEDNARGDGMSKNVEDDSAKEEKVESVKEKPKRRGRARNVSVDLIEDNGQGQGTPKKNEDESAKEEEMEKVDKKPLPKRRGRARHISVEPMEDNSGKKEMPENIEDEPVQEEEKETVQIEVVKKSGAKRTNRKAKPASQPTKKAGKKHLVTEEEDTVEQVNDNVEEVEEKRTNRVPVPEEKEPVRKLRRKQLVIEEDDELAEEENKENAQGNAGRNKGTKRKNQKTESVLEENVTKENVEDAGHGKSRSRRQPAKSQVEDLKKIVAEESPINSPRSTRQRRVNFKYGSEFITDLDKESKSESSEESKPDGKKRQRKAKVVEQSEEIDNPIRRSKRTRK